MNVERIYSLRRDEAFADLFEAERYKTFVAMPFNSRGGYPNERVRALLKEVHDKANEACGNPRFAPLYCVNELGNAARNQIDQIVEQILGSHIFLGDLTGNNFGVVIETGLALALKPNDRILLFSQDPIPDLHFDLKPTHVNQYTEGSLVALATEGLLQAAKAFETEADRYIRSITAALSSDAITLMGFFPQLWQQFANTSTNPSLWEERAESLEASDPQSRRFHGEIGHLRYIAGVRELLGKRLVWTDYRANAMRLADEGRSADMFGLHPTRLGWTVINVIWNFPRPDRAPQHPPVGTFEERKKKFWNEQFPAVP